jgi:hypothetical protein
MEELKKRYPRGAKVKVVVEAEVVGHYNGMLDLLLDNGTEIFAPEGQLVVPASATQGD